MLGQPVFEKFCQRLLHRMSVTAGRAAPEVSVDLSAQLRREPPPLAIEEMKSRLLTVHLSPSLA
jgi:hypothetical protein